MIRVCVDRELPKLYRAHGPACAARENPLNDPSCASYRPYDLPIVGKAAIASDKKWAIGRVLPVTMRGGSPTMRDTWWKAARIWMEHANIVFQPVAEYGVIRVAFDPTAGSWSYIGTDALAIPANQATMNIGWGPDLSTNLHEIGHALGLIHEHQNPAAPIPWDVRAVLRFYKGPPNYWSERETYEQVINRYAGPLTNGGYDRNSIMEYPIDANLVTDKTFAVGWNNSLSDMDKSFIGKIYPRSGTRLSMA